MKLKTPQWWYRRDRSHAPVMRLLLKPLGWIWAAETARRIKAAVPVDPGCAVISVGNLTVGGSGKTPVAGEVLRLLREHGVEAQALSRGHGGRLEGPVRVDPDRHTAEDVGDEPLMLAQGAPAWIARDRAAGARAAAESGADVVVLDDGHQNPALMKTVSLVVVDGETRGGEWPFGDGSIFPSGPMREPLAAGLVRADAVVVIAPTDADEVSGELLAAFGDLPVFIAQLRALQPPPSGPLLGFAGVAKPWKVERALKAAGADLVDFVPFPDHAPYQDKDFAFLQDRAAAFGAGLITTEKDWVRLSANQRRSVTAWPVVTRFEDESAFSRFLLQRLSMRS